jgi:hypothetical protein
MKGEGDNTSPFFVNPEKILFILSISYLSKREAELF